LRKSVARKAHGGDYEIARTVNDLNITKHFRKKNAQLVEVND